MSNYSHEEQQVLTKEMSDKIYNDSYSTTEEELQKDTNWIEATKDVYQQLEGVEWSGSDEDAAKKGLEMMGRFNYNLTLGTINYTAQLQNADDKTKLSFYYMMDMYDKKDISGNGVMRAFKEMGLDPASYIGIGTLGMGFVGKQAAATTAKTGLKAMLKQGAIKLLQSPAAVGGIEAGIYTGVDDIARQDAAIGAGVQDEYKPGQTAVATAIGAGVGAGFVKGGQALGRGVKKVVNEGNELMMQQAGGGTPPKVDAELGTTEYFKRVGERLGLKDLYVYDSRGDIKLDNIIVHKDQQKQGLGTEALEEVIKYADERGKRVKLTPGQPDDRHGTTSRARLVKFYKRFGFVENKGRNKDFTISEGMYREPQGGETK